MTIIEIILSIITICLHRLVQEDVPQQGAAVPIVGVGVKVDLKPAKPKARLPAKRTPKEDPFKKFFKSDQQKLSKAEPVKYDV